MLVFLTLDGGRYWVAVLMCPKALWSWLFWAYGDGER